MNTKDAVPPSKAASEIVRLVAACRAARALTTAVSLGVFDALAAGPKTASETAEGIDADRRALEILLDALASLGFLDKSAGRYSNSAGYEGLLRSGRSGSLAGNLRWQELLAPAWAELPKVVREGRPSRELAGLITGESPFAEDYMRAMADISRQPARELAEALDLDQTRDLLDVGGGPAAYSLAMLARAPRLNAVVLDLPASIRVAEDIVEGAPGRERLTFEPGDYHSAPFGRERFDLVLLSHVTHDEGEPANRALLKKAFVALRPGGRVVIHDFVVSEDRTAPTFGALFSLHMLVYTKAGRTYTAGEYESWLADAGFAPPRRLDICRSADNASLALIAGKP